MERLGSLRGGGAVAGEHGTPPHAVPQPGDGEPPALRPRTDRPAGGACR